MQSTQANRTASGASTVEMSPGVAVWLTVAMNQTKPPMAHTASTGLTTRPGPVPPPVRQDVADHGGHHGEQGHRRLSSPWLQQAAAATTTVGRRCHPERDRVLGRTRACWPGPPVARGSPRRAPVARSGDPRPVRGAGTARARRRPRSIRSRTHRAPCPSVSWVAEHHRPAPAQGGGDRRAMTRSVSVSAASGSARQHQFDDDGVVGLALPLADHQRLPTWEVAGQWTDRRVSPAW